MTAPDCFHATNGVRIGPGGYPLSGVPCDTREDLAAIAAAQAEFRERGGDMSATAQRENAHVPADTAESDGSDNPTRALQLLPASMVLTPAPIAWAVRGLLERNSLAEFSGEAGSFKTFAVVDLACSIVTGRDWCGHSVDAGPVLLFIGEGRAGLGRRLQAWSIANNTPLDHAPLFVSNHAAALTDEVRAAELVAVVAEFQRAHGAPMLIVFDTLNRNFGPADENSTADMTRAVATLDELREMTAAAVLVVHHVGHGDKSRGRGSSVLFGALDAAYLVEKDESGIVRLTARKMKDADAPEPMAFRPETVELGFTDDEGEPVTSAALRTVSYTPPPKTGKAGRGKHQTTALQLLVEATERHRFNVEKSGRDPDVARVALDTWRDLCAEADIDRRRFSDVLRTLQNVGRVRVSHGFVELGEGFV
ncbi:MAG TPA: AAA family ATPase [Mycoplana sp.]|nr:AAA family ATPase [Mycoplana sp.]